MRESQIRLVCWFGDLNCIVEQQIAAGGVPAKFLKLYPKSDWERLRKKHGLPTKATSWMQEAALTLYLALQKAPPRPMAEIRKALKELVGHFKRLDGALARLDFDIEWVLDGYERGVDAETGEVSFGPTASPHLELFRQYLGGFLDRAKAADLPISKAGRPKALHTLALWVLASHLRKTKPNASSKDLVGLAMDLFDPILLADGRQLPRWSDLVPQAWPSRRKPRRRKIRAKVD